MAAGEKNVSMSRRGKNNEKREKIVNEWSEHRDSKIKTFLTQGGDTPLPGPHIEEGEMAAGKKWKLSRGRRILKNKGNVDKK